jgi:ABC-type transport system involved in cytochrome c biogenesis permease subunit
MKLQRFLPVAAGVLALVGAALLVVPPRPVRGFDLDTFARLPVLEGGRVKPIDSVARNSLLMIRGKQTIQYQEGDAKRTVGPDEWLLDVLFRPDRADAQPLFVIDDPEVLGLIGIRQSANRYYAFDRLKPHLAEIQRQYVLAEPIEAKVRSRFQAAVVNLFERLWLYDQLKNTMQLEGSAGLLVEVAAVGSPGAAGRQAALTQTARFKPLPPTRGQPPEGWTSTGEALRAAGRGDLHPALAPWGRLGLAWAVGDAAAFGTALGQLSAVSASERPEAVSLAGHELVFNRAQPFYMGMVFYVLAMLAVFASWLGFARSGPGWPQTLRTTAFWLLLVGALVHTAGLISRIILQGRPPVTNLYSSAVFVGWGAVLLGIVLERMYRRGFATAVAAASGFASLLVAHHLTGDGDTMEMMRAVLDSNFWLGTHVVTITIGYAGTFLAGAIAIFWTLRRHLAPRLEPDTGKVLSGMVYGVVAFALFFSFLGTVLGGIWADQSWGRFWGWDPKENGALLIVLWNAIILHARWGGYARERGIMAMAIFGNVITSLSWFGVNMLGVGLHSYGFMDKAFVALAAFCGSQLVLMGLALLPRRFWARMPEAEDPRASRAAEGKA